VAYLQLLKLWQQQVLFGCRLDSREICRTLGNIASAKVLSTAWHYPVTTSKKHINILCRQCLANMNLKDPALPTAVPLKSHL